MAEQSRQQSSVAREDHQQQDGQLSEQQDRSVQSYDPSGSRSSYQQHQPPPQPYYSQQSYSAGGNSSIRPHGPGIAHHDQFGMEAMMQSYQQSDYRQQPRYAFGNRDGGQNFHPGLAMSSFGPRQPMQPVLPFTHAAGQVLSQAYYMPQQPQTMPPNYYGGRSAMQPTGSAAMTPRHGGYGFYTGQAPTPNYFYSQPSQYTHQHHHPQNAGASRGSSAGSSGHYSLSPFSSRRSSQSAAGFYRQDGVESYQKLSQRSHQGQSQTSTATLVRGPPRKPKQSGHAIWIGNLPPHTDLMSLVHHVCQQTTGLISLFLISKSNCAFANYPDEEQCIEAQQKLNDSYYMSVSLVSRLRKNSVEGAIGANVSTEVAALSLSPQSPLAKGKSADEVDLRSDGIDAGYTHGDLEKSRKPSAQTSVIVDGSDKSGTRVKNYDGSGWNSASPPVGSNSGSTMKSEKYFILKSLTLRDLELSVQTGIWATQSHNEETLNEAYRTCDNVYLIFSANKSGEYFGYARMMSEINQDPAAAIEFAPTSQSFNDADLPKAIPTEATETTPRGRIVDDSARGTIFWEVQSNEADDADEKEGEDELPDASDGTDDVSGADNTDGDEVLGSTGESQTWGKPFKLEWLSTTRLPFYRTRGLRNPLNANREIKIARDGTDVDVAIGRKLVSLFHQDAANSSPAGPGGTGNSLSGMPSSLSCSSLPGARAP